MKLLAYRVHLLIDFTVTVSLCSTVPVRNILP